MIGATLVRRAAEMAARLTYRDVELLAHRGLPDGPVLAVSNHFGGAADAVLLIYLSERMPRIVARDMIWRVPVARSVMRSIQGIPVHKAEDPGDGRSANDAMFGSCYDALADGSLVLIFPEGVTQDDPYLAPVKTGAARIALGARAAGVAGITILPVGIHYENKAAFRSRVLVAVGEPIDLDEVAPTLDPAGEPVSADNRTAVTSLTDQIATGMRSVGPDYRDWDQARDLQLAATTVLRHVRAGQASASEDVPMALTEQLGGRLAQRPDPVRLRVREAARQYQTSLDALRLTDYQLASSTRRESTRRTVLDAFLTVLLVPYALVGALAVAVPYLLVQGTRLIPAAPAVRATILPIVALLAFLAEWVWLSVSVASRQGAESGAVIALLLPAFVGATVVVAERAVLLWRALRRWVASRRRGLSLRAVRQQRDDLLVAVREAL